MLDKGQQAPILVRADGARFVLVEGLHRLDRQSARRKNYFLFPCRRAEVLMTLAVEPPTPSKDTPEKEKQVAPRQIKMPGKDNSDKEAEEVFSQRKRPESGRYLLQVDKQTKGSYKTPEAAQSAALEIKRAYPIIQVSIYDSVDNSASLIELPDAVS